MRIGENIVILVTFFSGVLLCPHNQNYGTMSYPFIYWLLRCAHWYHFQWKKISLPLLVIHNHLRVQSANPCFLGNYRVTLLLQELLFDYTKSFSFWAFSLKRVGWPKVSSPFWDRVFVIYIMLVLMFFMKTCFVIHLPSLWIFWSSKLLMTALSWLSWSLFIDSSLFLPRSLIFKMTKIFPIFGSLASIEYEKH